MFPEVNKIINLTNERANKSTIKMMNKKKIKMNTQKNL